MSRARLGRFATYLRPLGRSVGPLFAVILGALLINLPTPWLEKVIIDEAIGKGRGDLLLPLVGAIAALFLGYRLLLFLRGYLSVRLRQRVQTRVRMSLYEHLQRMSMAFFARNPSGALLSRVTNDVSYVQNLLNDELFEVIGSAVKVLLVLGLLLAISPELTLYCAAVLPALALVFMFFRKRVYARNLELQQTTARLSGQVQQSFAGMKLIQAETAEAQARDDTLAASQELERVGVRREMVGVSGDLLTTVCSYVPVLCVLWGVGGMMVIEKQLTLGALLAFTQYLLGLVTPVTRFFQFNMNLQAGYAALDRIFEVLDTPPQISDEPGACQLEQPVEQLRFEDVSLRYGTAQEQDSARGEAALQQLSFEIKRGERVALVGPSGAGKTSVLHLLLRFVDPSTGRVLVNGRATSDYTLASLRCALAYVSQDVFLFGDTVRRNLTLGRDVPDAKLQHALEQAAAEEVVEGLEQGLQTRLGEGGATLSGGQRQRLSLARGLARGASVYLLDEATAALDPATERRVLQQLRTFLQGRTALVVAHRPALLELVDRILVLADGRLVEQGTMEQLMQQRGVFWSLYRDRGE